MNRDATEARRSERVQFFLVPMERAQVPVWVFVPPERQGHTVGLILNLSPEGLQVMTDSCEAMDAPLYEVELLLGEDLPLPSFSGTARLVWSRPLTKMGRLHGLAFTDGQAPAAAFLAQYKPSVADQHWVRCLLRPLAPLAPAAAVRAEGGAVRSPG
ncbi:MAG: PilZ domain-containing protein [Rubrivivax sp.]|jgi:hypothetical protein